MRRRFVKCLGSFFYVGYLPAAPGTFASAAGLALAWVLGDHLFPAVVGASLAGFFLCRPAVRIFGEKDPAWFVLDEVCGMMLTVLWLPREALVMAGGFALFRFLDTLKPWPLSRIHKSSHPWSIMTDDLAAGAAANLVLQILL